MRKIKVLLITVIMLSAGSWFQQAASQEKTKEQQDKDLKLQQLIEEQKKSMLDQKKIQDSVKIEMYLQQDKMDDLMKDVDVQVEAAKRAQKAVRIYTNPRGDRQFSMDEPFVLSRTYEPYFGQTFGGDSERTTWDFSKSVKESSFTKDYSFDVEKTASTVIMSVMGDCKSGDIHIKIKMPNGKYYSDIVLDENGNLNWRKSFTISENENQDKTGEWKFQIVSNKATGFFKISLQTF
jgi:hypothetical protein